MTAPSTIIFMTIFDYYFLVACALIAFDKKGMGLFLMIWGAALQAVSMFLA